MAINSFGDRPLPRSILPQPVDTYLSDIKLLFNIRFAVGVVACSHFQQLTRIACCFQLAGSVSTGAGRIVPNIMRKISG